MTLVSAYSLRKLIQFKTNCYRNSGGTVLTKCCSWFHGVVFYVEATKGDTAIGRESSRHSIAADEYALFIQHAAVLHEEGTHNYEGIEVAGWVGLHMKTDH